MFVYFDNNGVIKEVINTEVSRQGNANINKIYAYYEGDSGSVTSANIRYKLPNGTLTQTFTISLTRVNKQIPYDKKQDLKFFEYFKNYSMYEVIVDSSVFNQTGLVSATIRFNTATTTYTMQTIPFMVQAGVEAIKIEEWLSLAQYNQLLRELGEIVGTTPRSFIIARTLLQNISGKTLSAFKTVDNTAYFEVQLSDGTALTVDNAKRYMKAIGGVYYVNEYDFDYPLNTYIMISDGSVYKVQYTNNQLRLYVMQIPYALKTYVSGTFTGNNWSTITINGVTKNIPIGGAGGKAVEEGYGIDVIEGDTKYTVSADTDVIATIVNAEQIAENTVNEALEDYRTSDDQDDIDATKEDETNKVTSINAQSTDTQYPSAKCVYDEIQEVIEKAEGKCASYVISYENNPLFNSSNTTIQVPTSTAIVDVDGNTIDITKLKKGDVIYITETDVPDRWFSGLATPNTRWQILETTKVNILTAGDGIAITNNEISVKVGEGLFFDSSDQVCLNNATRQTLAQVATKSTVSVGNTGTATDEVSYITVDGVEKKLAGGGEQFVIYESGE